MYTTLALLKASEACVPGYGRMISFFGTNAALKDQRIPLHVVSLIGGADDCGWALANALVLEEKEYQEFYRRNLPSALRCMLRSSGHTSRISPNNSDFRKRPHLKEFLNQAFKAETFEECEALLNVLRLNRFSHWLFEEVGDHDAWKNPYQFIAYCVDNHDATYKVSSPWAFKKDRAGGEVHQLPISNRNDLDGDEDNMDDDDDDDYDHRRPRRAASRAPEPAEQYFFASSKKTATKGQNVAALFTDTPYSFVGELKFKMPKGVKIENKDGQTVMTTTLVDGKSMFGLLRTLTEKSEAADLDQTN